jgi:hypothetical protein
VEEREEPLQTVEEEPCDELELVTEPVEEKYVPVEKVVLPKQASVKPKRNSLVKSEK